MDMNRDHYLAVYTHCRLVVAALSVLGGYLAFRWSRELFGGSGALVTLALWTFGPNILAHAGLVTPDLGATVFGLLASYVFWRYLSRPSLRGAVLSGVLLGLAEAAKFSLAVLPLAWAAAALVKLCARRRDVPPPQQLNGRRAAGHAVLVAIAAVFIVNEVYLFEGSGGRLGDFDFRSKLLSVARETGEAEAAPKAPRVNRFRGTLLHCLPVPLPEHYLLGFDDQMFDVDSRSFDKYLRGEWRHGEGWWYYYLYGLLVKTPLGTLVLVSWALLAAALRRGFRLDAVSESMLALPVIAVLVSASLQTGLNSHLRYVLPMAPFLFVSAGRLGRVVASKHRLCGALIALALVSNAISTLRVHPHYLTYFNEAAGGPRRGYEHLADSNIDWGQGLVALADWLKQNAPGRKITLAYIGEMDPEMLGIDYDLPSLDGPVAGVQAISTSFLAGLSATVHRGEHSINVPAHALTFYRRLTPIAVPGNSFYVYDLSPAEANRVRAELGRPQLPNDTELDPRPSASQPAAPSVVHGEADLSGKRH